MRHARALPHLKHVGTFAQIYYGELAVRDGFDDALFTDADGVISETTVANIGFLTTEMVVWPDAPALQGTTMQLLDRALQVHGVTTERRTVRVADLGTFAGAILTNSVGVVPVAGVNGQEFDSHPAILSTVMAAFAGTSWDAI